MFNYEYIQVSKHEFFKPNDGYYCGKIVGTLSCFNIVRFLCSWTSVMGLDLLS